MKIKNRYAKYTNNDMPPLFLSFFNGLHSFLAKQVEEFKVLLTNNFKSNVKPVTDATATQNTSVLPIIQDIPKPTSAQTMESIEVPIDSNLNKSKIEQLPGQVAADSNNANDQLSNNCFDMEKSEDENLNNHSAEQLKTKANETQPNDTTQRGQRERSRH